MIVHLYFNKIISTADQRGRRTLHVELTFADPRRSEEIVTEKEEKKNMPSAVTTGAADGGRDECQTDRQARQACDGRPGVTERLSETRHWYFWRQKPCEALAMADLGSFDAFFLTVKEAGQGQDKINK